MSVAALEWLEERLEGVPPELAAALRELVRRAASESGGAPEAGPDGTSRALASAALAGLDHVTAGRGGRDAALELLAADAALTYAFECAAERGSDLLALAARLGVRGELGARLAAALAAWSGGASAAAGGGSGESDPAGAGGGTVASAGEERGREDGGA